MLPSLRRAFERLRAAVAGESSWKHASGAEYWEERVRRMGRRAVFNRRHPSGATEKVTADLRAILLPLLSQCLKGTEKTLLDFGCGYGRFTSDFGRLINGNSIGVDPVEALIADANAEERTEFRLMHDGRIPMADGSADVITIIAVLSSITTPHELKSAVAELRRILAPDGLVFLADNTSQIRKQPQHVRFRSEAEYIELFSFAEMRRVGGYQDLGEQFSVFAGRLK